MSSDESHQNRLFRNKQTDYFLNLNKRMEIPYPLQHPSTLPDELEPNLRNFIVQDALSQRKKETPHLPPKAIVEDSFVTTLLEKINKLESENKSSKEEFDKKQQSWKRKVSEMKHRILEFEQREAKMKSIILDMTESLSHNNLYNKWHFDIQVCCTLLFSTLVLLWHRNYLEKQAPLRLKISNLKIQQKIHHRKKFST